MLETAETGHTIAKRTYARAEPALRVALVNAQFDLAQSARRAVVVLIAGVEAGGRHETAMKLSEWMDPRHLRVHAFGPRSDAERARPPQWRYWRELPAKGRIAIFMNAWYSDALDARVSGAIGDDELDHELSLIRDAERMLAQEGVDLVKFWIHLSKRDQKKRLAAQHREHRTSRRLAADDRERAKVYARSHEIWEHALRESSTGVAPWYVVEGADDRYRNLTVGRILLAAMERSIGAAPKSVAVARPAPAAPSVVDNVRLVRDLDLTRRLSDARYEAELPKAQARLARLTAHRRFAKHSLVLVFEGVDAAGKGGAIRRVTGALDPRCYEIVPVAAPTDEELAHPYLWRFWRRIPGHGGITIFDRSWYGRVLVERVEGFASEDDWLRAYGEINDFEESLCDAGAVICKFWLQVSRAEQLKRFRERQKAAFKRFKITPEDWRNRKRWGAYEQAVADMVDRTSTEIAPWTLVEAEDKRYARVKILTTIVERLDAALER